MSTKFYGWTGRHIRVDLTNSDVQVVEDNPDVMSNYLGARGLGIKYMMDEIDPKIDAFEPQNRFIIATGPLTCMPPAGNRTYFVTKSPLTGGIANAGVGGYFGSELKFAGFDFIIIQGKAGRPVYLWINNDKIELRSAEHIWGKGTEESEELLIAETDPMAHIAAIGPAGENLVRLANVITGGVTGARAAGRGGVGAVMGSKNLKAVAVRGTMDIEIAHPVEALEYNKRFIDQITSAKVNQTQGTLGTPFIWGATNSWGGVRTRNFQYNQCEYADDIEPERIDEICEETMGPYHMTGCFGCQVHCRAQYKIPEGPFAGRYEEGPEYTSLGAFGGETDTPRALTVLVGNHLVDQFGMDNLETGSLISWAMELYELGIITDKETDGLDLSWGNDNAVLEMVERICYRKGWLADALADGGIPASKKIGKKSFDYLVQVKGMSNLHSDERPTPALALNVATASRGSDHLRSRPAIDLYHLPEPVLRKIYGNPVAGIWMGENGWSGMVLDSFERIKKSFMIAKNCALVKVHGNKQHCHFSTGSKT